MAVRLGPSLASTLQRAQEAQSQIVLPRYNDFLHHNPEIVYDDWVLDDVTAGLRQKQESRAGRFGASSAGDCLRAQVLSYLGAPTTPIDTRLHRIFEDGKWRHMRLQAVLLQAGIIQRVEVGARWRRARAFGQVDGVGVVPDNHPVEKWRGKEFGLEIKGAMSFAFANIEKVGPDRYLAQVARYFLYAGFDLFVIVVESKDNQSMVEYVVSEDDVNTGHAWYELQQLNDAVDDRTLPPKLSECVFAKGQRFRSCPYGENTSNPCHQYPEEW